MSTEKPTAEPVTNGRVSLANGMLTTIGGLAAVAAGMGLESWRVHPLLIPLSFIWALVYALRIADAYVQMWSS